VLALLLFSIPLFVINVCAKTIFRLPWHEQVVAWPACVGALAWLTLWGRSRAQAAAPPIPGAAELQAAELPVSRRTSDLSAAAPVRAAGSVTVIGSIRNSGDARRLDRAGDPAADRTALLAGQAFRVTALRSNEGRWGYGTLAIGGQPLAVTWKRDTLPLAGPRRARGAPILPLALPSTIVLTRPVDSGRDRFPQVNGWLFTVVTIRTRDGQEKFALPTLDLPLVHAALELANAENAENAVG
jgi:hypothetical protein